MALSADYNYQWMLKLIRKNQAGGLSNIEYQYHWNDSSAAYMDDLLGRFQARGNSKEGVNTGLIENETIMTKLLPFAKPVVGLSVVAGQAIKPADFQYTLALRINGTKVFQVDHDTWWSVQQSVIDPPSISNNSYYYTEYGNYYSILPVAVSVLDLDYISTPVDMVWGFIFDGNGRQVYDPSSSVQPVWDNNSCREITKRALKTLGVSYTDQDFETFGQSVLTQGE
jgi:hypothetical protein